MQKEAVRIYQEAAYPDMISNHSRRRRSSERRATATLNAEFAAKHERDFRSTFGADGGEIQAMTAK